MSRDKTLTLKQEKFWFFVTFGAVHVLKLVNLLPNKVMLVLLNMCLLIALILFP